MSIQAAMAAIASMGAVLGDPPAPPGPPPSLAAPVLEGFVIASAATSTFTTGAFTPPANSRLIAGAMTRNGTANRTHGLPTTTVPLLSSFALIDSRNINPASTTNLRISLWEAVCAAEVTAGTAQMVTNANIGEGVFFVLSVEGTIARLTKGLADNATGTTLDIPMEDQSTPPATSLAIFLAFQNGTGGSALAASGFTMFGDLAVLGANARYGVGHDLTSPPASWTVTNHQNNAAKLGIGAIWSGNS